MRSAGGVLLAAGAMTLLVRKSSHHRWSDFELLLVALVPAGTLYAMALAGVAPQDGERAEPWRSVLALLAIALGPVALFEVLAWVGANTGNALYQAAVSALTAALAGYAAWRGRVSYAALLASLALLLSWLLVWDKILNGPSVGTARWLLVAGSALLLALAARLGRRGTLGAGEVATAGGIAAVAAGTIGIFTGLVTVGPTESSGLEVAGTSATGRLSPGGHPGHLSRRIVGVAHGHVVSPRRAVPATGWHTGRLAKPPTA